MFFGLATLVFRATFFLGGICPSQIGICLRSGDNKSVKKGYSPPCPNINRMPIERFTNGAVIGVSEWPGGLVGVDHDQEEREVLILTPPPSLLWQCYHTFIVQAWLIQLQTRIPKFLIANHVRTLLLSITILRERPAIKWWAALGHSLNTKRPRI